jgi:hypothetical protein
LPIILEIIFTCLPELPVPGVHIISPTLASCKESTLVPQLSNAAADLGISMPFYLKA